MATLTGAQGISTGKYHAGLLTNNEEWETACMKAGEFGILMRTVFTYNSFSQEFQFVPLCVRSLHTECPINVGHTVYVNLCPKLDKDAKAVSRDTGQLRYHKSIENMRTFEDVINMFLM